MKCICNNHPNIIQYKKYSHLKDGHICKYCAYENNSGENCHLWNGGTSPINIYLREHIVDWKKESMKNSNFKCVITGERFDVIHHLYGFDLILEEVLYTTKIIFKSAINDYTYEELNILIEKCIELHSKYPLGVCLIKPLHNIFHKEYGYGKNVPEQFEEFKQRYYNHEFDNVLNL